MMEMQIDLYISFIGYVKAFDGVKLGMFIKELGRKEVDDNCIRFIEKAIQKFDKQGMCG